MFKKILSYLRRNEEPPDEEPDWMLIMAVAIAEKVATVLSLHQWKGNDNLFEVTNAYPHFNGDTDYDIIVTIRQTNTWSPDYLENWELGAFLLEFKAQIRERGGMLN